jgi:hypothetical protein
MTRFLKDSTTLVLLTAQLLLGIAGGSDDFVVQRQQGQRKWSLTLRFSSPLHHTFCSPFSRVVNGWAAVVCGRERRLVGSGEVLLAWQCHPRIQNAR